MHDTILRAAFLFFDDRNILIFPNIVSCVLRFFEFVSFATQKPTDSGFVLIEHFVCFFVCSPSPLNALKQNNSLDKQTKKQKNWCVRRRMR